METWRNIENFPGYQVSDEGRVRSFINNRHGIIETPHILTPTISRNGRPTVCLGRGNRRLISRLVASAFLPNQDELPLVRHMDDNPTNNNVSNLSWGTQKDNMQDCVRHGRLVGNTGPAIESKKRRVIAISVTGNTRITFDSIQEAARELDLWPQHICNVLYGRISQTGGWRFIDAERGDVDE